MKISDLHPLLQIPYPNTQGYGIEKGQKPELANVAFVIPPPPGNQAPARLKMDLLRGANEIFNKLPRLENLNEFDRLVLSLLIRREALQSSRLEGAFSTIEQVLTPFAQSVDDEKSARASIVAYAHALEKSFEEVKTKGIGIFTEGLLRELHKEMMERDPEFRGEPGVFRNEIGSGVYATIGGLSRIETSVYNPVPPKHLLKSLHEHLAWMTDEESIEMSRAGLAPGLAVRMARGHWHFEAVHPFTDGNGRVGRMLMVLQMAAEGMTPLYLSGYIEAKKQDYYYALKTAQMKLDETPLIHFICESIIESYDESQKTKKALVELPLIWTERVMTRQDSAAKKMFSLLIESPILSVKFVQEKLGISQPAAKRAIDQLVAGKILRERTGQGRNRIFAAEEVVELLARPFGELTSTSILRAQKHLG